MKDKCKALLKEKNYYRDMIQKKNHFFQRKTKKDIIFIHLQNLYYINQMLLINVK